MTAANRELIREINQFHILNTIRNSGQISRIEIANVTGLSRAAVTNITASMIQQGIIFEKEIEDSTQRGRRRVFLALNPDAGYVVGVKVSSHQLSFAVTNLMAEVCSSLVVPVRIQRCTSEMIADLIEDGIRHCVSEAQLKISHISAIGIGVPGFVDSERGICYWSPLYQKGNLTLRDAVAQRFKVSTYLENDANTVTLAQQWFGQGQGCDNFLVITVEHGIGMGIVVHNRIYRGHRGVGAEFGHMVVRPEGKPCRCGKLGCIEAYASDPAIVAASVEAHQRGEWQHDSVEELTIEEITELAKQGNAPLQQIFKEAGEVLGLGIAGLVQIFNPAKIVIAGEGVRAENLLLGPLKEALQKHTNPEIYQSTQIVIPHWTDTDWARGAASLALQELYKSPVESIKAAG